MKNHHDILRHDGIEGAHEVLTSALDNPIYISYASETGPLTLDDVPTHLRVSDQFDEVLDHFGWPSEADTDIEPVWHFDDDQQFLDAFAAREAEFVHLNNFVAWIGQQPTYDSFHYGAPMEQMYARSPALHRLHAAAPDLAEAVRVLVADIRSRVGTHTAEMKQELMLDTNSDLLTAARMTYHIAGRLFTRNDKRLHATLALPGKDHQGVSDVTSAHEELTA